MKIKIAAYNLKNKIYQENVTKYNAELHEFYNRMDEEDDSIDPLLKKLQGYDNQPKKIIPPAPPEPPTIYLDGNIRVDLIVGYKINKEEGEIVLFLDATQFEQTDLLIKFDEKIIEKLDELLD